MFNLLPVNIPNYLGNKRNIQQMKAEENYYNIEKNPIYRKERVSYNVYYISRKMNDMFKQ